MFQVVEEDGPNNVSSLRAGTLSLSCSHTKEHLQTEVHVEIQNKCLLNETMLVNSVLFLFKLERIKTQQTNFLSLSVYIAELNKAISDKTKNLNSNILQKT